MPDVTDIFLDDTLVPSVFITDYMPDLGRTALHVYLMSLLHMAPGGKVKAKPVRDFLDLKSEDFKAALCELAGYGIVATEADFSSYVMLNLKKQALDKYYRRKTSDSMEAMTARTEADRERIKLIRSVNETFFHNLMGPAWFQAIDTWFELYHFEPSVIYQMFTDAAGRGTLRGPNYLNAVAEDYNRNGVKSFADLVEYKERHKRSLEICSQIGRKLKKNMTHYDEILVNKWVADFGYGMDIIELALENAVRLSEPNLNYFDKILESWHEAGLTSAEEIRKLQKNKAHMRQLKRKKRGQSSKAEEAFEQREYEDSFFEQFAGIDFISEDETEQSKDERGSAAGETERGAGEE